MYWFEEEETLGMQIVWRNPLAPRWSRSRPRLLELDMDTTIYVTGSPDVEAVFELIPGGNIAAVAERSAEMCPPAFEGFRVSPWQRQQVPRPLIDVKLADGKQAERAVDSLLQDVVHRLVSAGFSRL
jgi:hypothetical protein